jgi:DNA-binding MarR family transcriptional regulator/GNAT superfamily N-acetyltransferase
MRDAIERLRRFNRTVTQRVGALEDRFLARDRPLGEARVLWEIGDGMEVRELRRRLDLDAGYLSRLLRSLEQAGLAVVDRSPTDRRVGRARLTEAGRAERSVLDRRSDGVARSLLEPLNDGQRQRLVEALDVVERLLTAGLVTIDVADPAGAAARFCVASYFRELDARFDGGFDPASSIPADDDELRPPAGLLLVATLRQEPIGCGALKLHGAAPCEIKRMWVSPSARGLGVGRRLLQELERRAAERGVTTVRLETNGSLKEAIALYRAAGYIEVERFSDEPYAHHWFEKPLLDAGGRGRAPTRG